MIEYFSTNHVRDHGYCVGDGKYYDVKLEILGEKRSLMGSRQEWNWHFQSFYPFCGAHDDDNYDVDVCDDNDDVDVI